MKKKWIISLLAIGIIVLSIVVGLFFVNSKKLKASARNDIVTSIDLNDYKKQSNSGNSVLSDDKYVFTLDRSNGEFHVVEKASNHTWSSTPEGADADKTANGLGKQWLHSQLIVKYYNDRDNLVEVTSQTAAVKKGGLDVYESDNSICCVYRFIKENFEIPVCYSLTEDGLSVTIPFQNIKENSDYKVSSIGLLPYFGAIGEQSEGYLFLPDGCGAIVQLTPESDGLKDLMYEKMIYGRDRALSNKVQTTNQQDLLFPVYASCSDGGLIATITEGDAISSLKIQGEGFNTGYNNIMPICTVRARDTIVLYENTINEATLNVYQKKVGYKGNFTVSYHLMSEDFSYSDIAEHTANYYQKQIKTTTNTGNLKLYIQTEGVTQKLENHIGIPMYYDYALTTAGEANDFVEELSSHGVKNTMLLYYGIFNKGEYDVTPVGGKLNKLISNETLQKCKATVVPMLDLVRVYKSGNGVSLSDHVCRSIQGTKLTVSPIAINTGKEDKIEKNYSLLRSDFFYDAYSRTISNLQKYGFSAFGDMGIDVLASDFSKEEEISRQDALTYYREVMEKVSDGFQTSVTQNFYGYHLPYITDVANLPICSSMLSCFSYDVPFAELVVSRFIDYGTVPLNEISTDKIAIMKMLEYRACPSYRLMSSELTELVNTYVQNDMIGSFSDYSEEIISQYDSFSDFYEKASGPLVASERIAPGVFVSEYQNGAKVIFNYNDTPFLYENTSVESESYVFLG